MNTEVEPEQLPIKTTTTPPDPSHRETERNRTGRHLPPTYRGDSTRRGEKDYTGDINRGQDSVRRGTEGGGLTITELKFQDSTDNKVLSES